MGKRVLIIGGYGNFGSYIARRLSKESDITEANVDITDLTNKNSTLLIVYFGINSSILDKAPREALDKLYTLLSKDLNMVVGISGHTCNIGDAAYNVMLSNARAQSVMAYLVEKGIADKRLKAAGSGDTKPIASNETKEGRILNRRAELKLGDITGKPIKVEINFATVGDENIGLTITEAVVCKDVKDREPIGSGITFNSTDERLYYYSKIRAPATSSGSVSHVWYYKDKKMAEIPLSYKGPQWRTYSSKWIVASWTGEWRVEVVTEKGQVIKSTSFTVE